MNTRRQFLFRSLGAAPLLVAGSLFQLSSRETSREKLGAAQTLAKLAEVDLETAELFLNQTLSHFPEAGLTKETILNKMTVLAREYPTTVKDTLLAVGRSSSVAEEAGVNFYSLLAMVAVLSDIGNMQGSWAGFSLRNIFTRMARRETQKELRESNITTHTDESKFLGVATILAVYAHRVETVSPEMRSYLNEKIAGIYSQRALKALLVGFQQGASFCPFNKAMGVLVFG